MTGLKLAYVCGDAGIAPDGTKGASIHYRELGRALVGAGIDVRGVTVRSAAPGATVGFPVHSTMASAPSRSVPSRDPRARELALLLGQDDVRRALEQAGPFDAVYERYSLFGLGGAAFARAKGIPFVLEVNAPLWVEAQRYRSLGLGRLAKGVAEELFRLADRILPVSAKLAEQTIFHGAAPDRVQVVPNGVADCFFEDGPPRQVPPAFQGRPALVFVGSLKEWHGVEFLLEAFTSGEHPGMGLWIVGDGPLRHNVEAATREWPDRVAYQAGVPHEEVPAVLRAAGAAVAPYTTHAPDYFCPLKVLEALAVGLPVVGSRTSPNQFALARAAEAWWFDPGDVTGFRSALKALLTDLDAARARARAHIPKVQHNATWGARAAELSGVITDLCRGPRAMETRDAIRHQIHAEPAPVRRALLGGTP